ncbi:MAG TPA: FHA domain-containing protein [Gemmatimonadaceae bacterium]|nr:FHA domain-containing protein [Gemmatimonadaceae bacterium]
MDGVILRHLGGSRAGCVQRYAVAELDGLVLGHDAYADVRFDAARDAPVARQHACIIPDPRTPWRFVLVDLESRSGTYLNQRRVAGTAALAPGDVIQLGPGGPELQFDLLQFDLLSAPVARTGGRGAMTTRLQGIRAPLSTAEIGSSPRST